MVVSCIFLFSYIFTLYPLFEFALFLRCHTQRSTNNATSLRISFFNEVIWAAFVNVSFETPIIFISCALFGVSCFVAWARPNGDYGLYSFPPARARTLDVNPTVSKHIHSDSISYTQLELALIDFRPLQL